MTVGWDRQRERERASAQINLFYVTVLRYRTSLLYYLIVLRYCTKLLY